MGSATPNPHAVLAKLVSSWKEVVVRCALDSAVVAQLTALASKASKSSKPEIKTKADSLLRKLQRVTDGVEGGESDEDGVGASSGTADGKENPEVNAVCWGAVIRC